MNSSRTSRTITLKDALKEMDVHEDPPVDTPIIIFSSPSSSTYAPQQALHALIETADRVIAHEHTSHTVSEEDIEALTRAVLGIRGLPANTELRARLQRVGDILRIAGNRTSLSDQAYIECIGWIDEVTSTD